MEKSKFILFNSLAQMILVYLIQNHAPRHNYSTNIAKANKKTISQTNKCVGMLSRLDLIKEINMGDKRTVYYEITPKGREVTEIILKLKKLL